MATIDGTAGDDSLLGTAGDDTFNLVQGGSDTASGGDGLDIFEMGAGLDRSDRLDGGGGDDILVLGGDYSAGFVFGAHTARSFESLQVREGAVCDLTFHDAMIAPGGSMFLAIEGALTLDATAETNGRLVAHVRQTSGPADLTLGAGDDVVSLFRAPGPGDAFHGGAGLDTLQLQTAIVARFTAASLSGFEALQNFGNGSRIALDDGVVAAGQALLVSDFTATGLFLNAGAERDGRLSFTGAEGGDSVIGGRGADTLTGGLGDDVLKGGRGGDRIDLGPGVDRVLYQSHKDSRPAAMDSIFGLVDGDQIDLSAVDAQKGAPGDQAFVLVAAPTGAAGEAWLAYDGVNTTLWLEVNGKGAADMAVLLADGDHTAFTGFVL